MKTVMELIWAGLQAGQGSALLIGGHALSAFGYQRQTLDVDCLVADSGATVLHDVLTGAGYQEIERTEIFVHYSHPSVFLLDVDVMRVDRETFEKLHAQSIGYRIGKAEMRVPCLSHLIALKLHAMKNNPKRALKDLGDIVALLQENPGIVRHDELAALCRRYGPENSFHQIERHQ